MLRPEPAIRRAMLNGLAQPEAASSAAWYLARMNEATPEILTVLVRVGAAELVPAVERYARRVPEAETVLVGLLPELTGGALGLACYGLAAIPTGPATQGELLERARAALAGPDLAARAAAEIVGRIGREDPDIRAQLGAVLARDGISPQLRHNVVLGLVNLHLPPSPPPSPQVRARLERIATTEDAESTKDAESTESTEDAAAGRLARWLLNLLPPDPTRP